MSKKRVLMLCTGNSARSQMAEGYYVIGRATSLKLVHYSYTARGVESDRTVVGMLVEVPVMLCVRNVCNRTRHWFPLAQAVGRPERAG